MSKDEIVLELTKLVYEQAIKDSHASESDDNVEKIVADLYNYFFDNIRYAE